MGCRIAIHPPTGRAKAHRRIENVNLSLPRGSFTVITGRIGSGKSTLVRVLLGLLPKDAGEIVWNGARVDDPAAFFRPPRCAYTSQVPRLFSDTLRDNILMGLPEDRVDLSEAIRLAVLEEDVAALTNGLDTVVGPRGVRLSGGQVQRAAAARMFVREPELLVFDDLSSALDVETERTLWERLANACGFAPPLTCLVVSHRRAALEAGRSHHRAQRWPRRGRGQAGRAAGDVRRDAPALARRCGRMKRLICVAHHSGLDQRM